MNELTGLQRDTLIVISGLKEPNGVDIQKELQNYHNTDIHRGKLYPLLETLIEKDLVTKRQREGRSNEYRLTDSGERTLKDHLNWQCRCLPNELTGQHNKHTR